MDVFPFTVLDVVVMGQAAFLKMTQTPGDNDYRLAMEALKMLASENLARSNFNRISGWARFPDPLLSIQTAVHIWIVRESLVEKVGRRWSLEPAEIIHVEAENSFAKLKIITKKGVNL
ncbi:MAG: hypothetical protein U9Q39_01350 [Pseudomonadota bacterium]|nr:hypothetical protein [Pseudomonadota bacterium]